MIFFSASKYGIDLMIFLKTDLIFVAINVLNVDVENLENIIFKNLQSYSQKVRGSCIFC